MVNAVVLTLSTTRGAMSSKDMQDSYETMIAFVSHYAREPVENIQPSCANMYNIVLERMRSDAKSDALVPVVHFGLTTICVFMLAVIG